MLIRKKNIKKKQNNLLPLDLLDDSARFKEHVDQFAGLNNFSSEQDIIDHIGSFLTDETETDLHHAAKEEISNLDPTKNEIRNKSLDL